MHPHPSVSLRFPRPIFPPSSPSAIRNTCLSTRPSTCLPARRRRVSIRFATRESQTAPASYSPCRPPAPVPLRLKAIFAPPAQSPQFPTRTSDSPSRPAPPSSTPLSTPRPARHTKRPCSSASHSKKSRDQPLPDPPPPAPPLPSRRAPQNQPRSPPKPRRYPAPSASAPPPQSLHP